MPKKRQPSIKFDGTIFNYVYRDAGNFKAYGSVLLSGKLLQAQQSEIVAKMESHEFFIAEQIGVKSLYSALYAHSGGMTHNDHVWHTFINFEQVLSGTQIAELEFWGTANDLLLRFRNVDNWSLQLSPHWAVAA